MKKFLAFLSLSLLFLFSCADLDDVHRRLDDHEARLKTLETLIQSANNDVKTVQALLDAQSRLINIVSYTELSDKSGYELTMSDGSKIELKNGKDGNKPIIGVKEHTDGLLYWTIDGEFMRDADNNLIKAEGQDGQNGITPVIRINLSGHWEVSTDNGKTWQLIVDSEGNPIAAKGKDGSVDLIITETEDALIITYNGHTYTIYQGAVSVNNVVVEPSEKLLIVDDVFQLTATVYPTYANNKEVTWSSSNETVASVNNEGVVTAIASGNATITVTSIDGSKKAYSEIIVQERPMLPIEFVAEYNINETGDGFTSSHANSINGYFNWEEAMEKFAPEKNFTVDDKKHYLPTHEEWNGIIPNNSSGVYVHFSTKRNRTNITETITFNGDTKDYLSDYISVGGGLAYSIRLKGQSDDLYKSAYRYQLIPNPDDAGNAVKVTVRYLGPNSDIIIDNITDEEWWNENDSKDITRVFPLAGQIRDNAPYQAGANGYYWSTTEINFERARTLYIGSFPTSGGNYYKTSLFPVRLFMNK